MPISEFNRKQMEDLLAQISERLLKDAYHTTAAGQRVRPVAAKYRGRRDLKKLNFLAESLYALDQQ